MAMTMADEFMMALRILDLHGHTGEGVPLVEAVQRRALDLLLQSNFSAESWKGDMSWIIFSDGSDLTLDNDDGRVGFPYRYDDTVSSIVLSDLVAFGQNPQPTARNSSSAQ